MNFPHLRMAAARGKLANIYPLKETEQSTHYTNCWRGVWFNRTKEKMVQKRQPIIHFVHPPCFTVRLYFPNLGGHYRIVTFKREKTAVILPCRFFFFFRKMWQPCTPCVCVRVCTYVCDVKRVQWLALSVGKNERPIAVRQSAPERDLTLQHWYWLPVLSRRFFLFSTGTQTSGSFH